MTGLAKGLFRDGFLTRLTNPYVLVYVGKMARALLGFLVLLAAARWLGPEAFGLLSFFIAIMIIGNNLLGDGLDPGIVRFYAEYVRSDADAAQRLVRTAFTFRLMLGVPVVLLAIALGDRVGMAVFGDAAYSKPFTIGVLGAFAAALWGLMLSIFQAKESFLAYSILTPMVNAFRVLTIPVLILISQFHLDALMWLHVVFFLAGAVCCGWYLRSELTPLFVNSEDLRVLLRFSKWTLLASFAYILQGYLGVPAISYFSTAEAAGIYAASIALLTVIDQVTIAVLTVQLPAVSRLTKREEYVRYIRRYVPRFTLLALVLAPIMLLFAKPLVLLVYGPEYDESIIVFRILLLGFLATLVTHPLYLIFYSMNRPNLYALTTTAGLLVWLAAAIYLIPGDPTQGAAWAMLAARLVQALIIVILLAMVLHGSDRIATRKTT